MSDDWDVKLASMSRMELQKFATRAMAVIAEDEDGKSPQEVFDMIMEIGRNIEMKRVQKWLIG